MRGATRDLWRAGIAIAGMLLLLVLMAWIPVSAASAEVRASGFAATATVTVQATPTVDATVTALNKEKLAQEVQQLKEQNEPDLLGWLRTNTTVLVVVIGGLIGLFRWFGDRSSEREKRAEERFQAAVAGLGDEKEGARIGAAIVLRTFLREGKGHEQFYAQIFDLAVAHLRLRSIDADKAEPLDSLSQALITLFRESFSLVRKQHTQDIAHQLDAACIQLDKAFLAFADLQQAWMPFAHLREANLPKANLPKANLYRADLSEATLYKASLCKASLRGANLSGTELGRADLSGADLSGANLRDASSLRHANLRCVKGLTKEQLEACKAKGAIIDEDARASSSQPTVAPALSPQSNDAQAPPAPAAQGSTPAAETGESSAPSSKPGQES